MTKRKPTARTRIYWRGGSETRKDGTTVHRARRAYADFRDYSDVGGGREPLKPAGAAQATEDSASAEALVTARLGELKRLRRDRALIGEGRKHAALGDVARQHLVLKAESRSVTDRWIGQAELYLGRACAFFGASRPLSSIGVADVRGWIADLEGQPGRRGNPMSPGNVRHHLNALSNCYARAASLDLIPQGMNPVAAMMPGERPIGRRQEAAWLEVHEAAALLEVARRTPAALHGCQFMHPLLATLLLTGGRKSEVLGLEVDDVNFNRATVTFRPNDWRRLKTPKSHRTVPLWPQLAEILRPHIVPMDRTPREGLLFPGSARDGSVAMIADFDKALDVIAKRAGWKRGEVRSRAFRNTYIAARLQTLDRGAPVSPYAVAREVGHADMAMIENVYGHVGQVRHRADVVEFRVEQHRELIAARFAQMDLTASGVDR